MQTMQTNNCPQPFRRSNARQFLSAQLTCALLLLAPAVSAHAQQTNAVPIEGAAVRADMHLNPNATPEPGKTVHLVFPLNGHDTELQAFAQSQQDPNSPNFHHWLTPREVGARFGATPEDIAAVVAFARAQGFTVTHVWPHHLTVSADATIARAEKAFGVKVKGYDRPANTMREGDPTTFFAPDRSPLVPADIAHRIRGVIGLDNYTLAHPMLRKRADMPSNLPPSPFPGLQGDPGQQGEPDGLTVRSFSNALTPSQVSTLNNIDGLHAKGLYGQGMSVAIFSPTRDYDSDINSFAAKFGLSGYSIQHLSADSGPISYSSQGEACLDAETIIGQAPNVNVIFYEGSSDSEIWSKISADNIGVVSTSWGYTEPEPGHIDVETNTIEHVLTVMNVQGQSIYASSGDVGAYDYDTPGAVNLRPNIRPPAPMSFRSAAHRSILPIPMPMSGRPLKAGRREWGNGAHQAGASAHSGFTRVGKPAPVSATISATACGKFPISPLSPAIPVMSLTVTSTRKDRTGRPIANGQVDLALLPAPALPLRCAPPPMFSSTRDCRRSTTPPGAARSMHASMPWAACSAPQQRDCRRTTCSCSTISRSEPTSSTATMWPKVAMTAPTIETL